MRFYHCTIVAGGRYSRREHASERLAVESVDVFREMLTAGGTDFVEPVPVVPEFELHFSTHGPSDA